MLKDWLGRALLVPSRAYEGTVSFKVAWCALRLLDKLAPIRLSFGDGVAGTSMVLAANGLGPLSIGE